MLLLSLGVVNSNQIQNYRVIPKLPAFTNPTDYYIGKNSSSLDTYYVNVCYEWILGYLMNYFAPTDYKDKTSATYRPKMTLAGHSLHQQDTGHCRLVLNSIVH